MNSCTTRHVSSFLWVLVVPASAVGVGQGSAPASVRFSVTVVLWVWAVKEELVCPLALEGWGEL